MMNTKDKILLITGGTGSFGNAVLKRFLNSDLKEIRIFSRDEKKQDDMRHLYNNPKIKFFVGDVRNYESINKAMQYVDYVFHAAALKQVPSCEFFPMEAVQTNVIGCNNVLQAAIQNNVKKVIVLSTDKAVYPISVMGMTKALGEKLVIDNSRRHPRTVICATRYGNVMGSRGSVIPLFMECIRSGKPITITNGDMLRFMMTLDEAVDLVLFAFEYGMPGDLFVQKAPAASINTLVEALFQLHGRTEIENVGIRHGEKMYETLITKEEMTFARDMGKYYRVPANLSDSDYSGNFIASEEDYTSQNTEQLGVEGMIKLLLKLY
jgi:UDP-glucose 4-epimerase